MKKALLFLSAVALLAWSFPVPVAAAEIDAGFSVYAVIPDNQRDKEAAYFDLSLEPGKRQELVVQVHNPGTQAIDITVETVTASTNRSGFLHYGSPGIYDETMPCRFSDLAKAEEPSLTVAPGETADAVIILDMPEEPFDGLLLGSICLVKQPGEEELAVDGIVNQYSYVIGVRVWGDEYREAPRLALGDISVELVNYKASIIVPIRNPQPVILDGVKAEATIFQDSTGLPVIQKRQEEVEMAPNAVFPMTLLDQEGYGFPAGGYTAHVSVEYAGELWEFQQPFVIHPEQSSQVNNSAVNQIQHKLPSKSIQTAVVCLGAGLCAAAVCTKVGFYKKARKKNRL